jgi:hypothetical protein
MMAMKIDRSVVLFSFAATAAACQIYVDEPAKHPASPPPPSATAQGTPAAPPASAAPAHEAKVVQLRRPGEPAAPSGGTTPPAPAACLDTNAATVGDCAALPATCTPGPSAQARCNSFKTFFNPKIAAAAVACLSALPAAQQCDATQAANCGHTALAQSCAAPTVAQICQIAATPCKTTAADCAAAMSGLTAQGQQTVATCVAQGCGAGLNGCIDALASSSSTASASLKR